MSSDALAELQKHFLAYLQGSDQVQFSDYILTQGEISDEQRLAIYRNAYRIRLKDVILVDHPVLSAYIGDIWFDKMTDEYINIHPSQYYSLRQFADHLPQYLNHHAPFLDHPQIGELARFERLLLTAFDAADAERATTEELSTLSPTLWPSLTLRFHPSVQLFQSEWNVPLIWKAIKNEQDPPIAIKEKCHWLIWRNTERLTEFHRIDDVSLTLFENFNQGYDLAYNCEQILALMIEDDVSSRVVSDLLGWLSNGLIHALIHEQKPASSNLLSV